jgi:hypothetical protein
MWISTNVTNIYLVSIRFGTLQYLCNTLYRSQLTPRSWVSCFTPNPRSHHGKLSTNGFSNVFGLEICHKIWPWHHPGRAISSWWMVETNIIFNSSSFPRYDSILIYSFTHMCPIFKLSTFCTHTICQEAVDQGIPALFGFWQVYLENWCWSILTPYPKFWFQQLVPTPERNLVENFPNIFITISLWSLN